MRRLIAPLLSLSLLGMAAPAAAQARGPNAPRLAEVERGFWVGSTLGAVFYPTLPGEGGSFSSGALIGIETGFDLADTLQIGAVLWGQAIGADADYKGITDPAIDPKGARGDFQSLLAGGSLRWSFLRLADENDVYRTYFYLRAAGGAAFSRPVGVVGDGIWFAGGPGVEYFTRLRHFSVGLEVDGMGMMTDEGEAIGFAILPHIKYSF